jgi:HK97 family phage major capsid protein
MTAEELSRLHQEYSEACEIARNPESDEQAAASQAIVLDLRHKLDEALIADKAEREDEQRAAAVEAREWAAKKAAQVETPEVRTSFPGFEDFVEGRKQSVKYSIPQSNIKSLREARTTYDMTTSDTSAYGSRLIPQTWADEVRLFEIGMSGVMQAGPTIINSDNAGQTNLPLLTTDMAAAKRTEGSANTDSGYPVFGTASLLGTPYSGWVSITEEMVRDSGPEMEALLGRLAGRSLGAALGACLGDIDYGTGASGYPASITYGLTSAVTCASQTAVTVDELLTLYQGVLPAYRLRGSFIANSAVTLSTMLSKDGQGSYLWAPAISASAPDTFMGKPWYEDAYFDASASGNIPVVFGDVQAAFAVKFVGPIEVSFSRDYQFPSFEISMRFQQVFDSATIDTIAVKGATLA